MFISPELKPNFVNWFIYIYKNMKEDKTDKWIASSLKKHQEEGNLPYEAGAWESFQKHRNAKKTRKLYYWSGAVAATLLAVVAVYQVLNTEVSLDDSTSSDTKEILADQSTQQQSTIPDMPTMSDSNQFNQGGVERIQDKSINPEENLGSKPTQVPTLNMGTELLAEAKTTETSDPEVENNAVEKPKQVENKVSSESNKVENKALAQTNKEEESNELNSKAMEKKPLTTSSQLAELTQSNEEATTILKEEVVIAQGKQNRTEEKSPEKLVAESAVIDEKDFPEIPKEQTKVLLAMGVTPGFGSSQQNDMMMTASSIGLGMQVDIELPGKMTLGSGVGVNYLNQKNETQSDLILQGYKTSRVEKQDIQQVQIEMPVYIKYPITRNNSVSVQAGFSNLYAINQNGEQLTTVNEQFAVNNSDNMLSSSSSAFALATRPVSQQQDLPSPEGKFYPFATLNLGVNFKVFESKKINYMVMPFYNHQLKSISGFGSNYGMFGASLKLKFGGGEK
ncbi:hypothetical protein ALPR1_08783 [Algoriphagus machipongonensis]|uniref:Outer membrane protein beta-barrel domain-containing protein n=2 Tax=Algoriphagus machipongonensis TaxID=388413 RepID=A3I1P1_9BACT|nr:hypothetical protein ALPR1_08783 [Algoriphagus machipongonensis]